LSADVNGLRVILCLLKTDSVKETAMSDDQPHFRFNPGVYGQGRSLEPSDDICDVCGQACTWKYVGSLYVFPETISALCARCIANGKLGDFLGNRDFSFHDIQVHGADRMLESELLQRTPGVFCFNPYEWPVLEGRPLAFLGYGEDDVVLKDAEAQAAIKAAFQAIGWDFEVGTSTPYALVFKEVDGSRYRAVIDLD
jgi:uncharacterized protein CbrC (UPF0167 family)